MGCCLHDTYSKCYEKKRRPQFYGICYEKTIDYSGFQELVDEVVVSNTFYFHPEPWGNDPISRAYFSNGLVQPPTSCFGAVMSFFTLTQGSTTPTDGGEGIPFTLLSRDLADFSEEQLFGKSLR